MASTALRQAEDATSFEAYRAHELRPANLVARPRADFDCPERLAQWDNLARHAAEPNPFFEHWYLLPALEALDPDDTVQILCLESSTRLLGMVPLLRKKEYYGRSIPHWTNWIHPNCFVGTPLVAEGREEAFWRELLAWADTAGDGLFLHIAELPMDGPLFASLRELAQTESRPGAIVRCYERAFLKRGESPHAYFEANVSKKRRKEYERRSRRLAEMGELSIERRCDDSDIAEWIEEFLALEHAGWKGRTGSSLLSSGATAKLFRAAATAAARRGQLDRVTIRLNGSPIAFLSSFVTPAAMFGFKTTFDEQYARSSLGVMLQREFLEVLGKDGFTWCDSCAGADHPMIDHFWRERRAMASASLAIGGHVRRTLFRALLMAEKSQPMGNAT